MSSLGNQFIKTGVSVIRVASVSATLMPKLVEQSDLISVDSSRSTCSVDVCGNFEKYFLPSSNLIIGSVETVKCCRSNVGAGLIAEVLAPVGVVEP